MTWLYENPWPTIIVGGIVELILVVNLYVTGRLRTVVWMLVVAAIAGGLLLYEHYTVTDREQIEADLHEIASAIERGDSKTALSHISPTAEKTIGRARYAVSLRASEIRINNDLKIDVRDKEDPPQAVASGTVTVSGSLRGYTGSAPLQVTVYLRKVDGKWLIYDHEEVRIGLR